MTAAYRSGTMAIHRISERQLVRLMSSLIVSTPMSALTPPDWMHPVPPPGWYCAPNRTRWKGPPNPPDDSQSRAGDHPPEEAAKRPDMGKASSFEDNWYYWQPIHGFGWAPSPRRRRAIFARFARYATQSGRTIGASPSWDVEDMDLAVLDELCQIAAMLLKKRIPSDYSRYQILLDDSDPEFDKHLDPDIIDLVTRGREKLLDHARNTINQLLPEIFGPNEADPALLVYTEPYLFATFANQRRVVINQDGPKNTLEDIVDRKLMSPEKLDILRWLLDKQHVSAPTALLKERNRRQELYDLLLFYFDLDQRAAEEFRHEVQRLYGARRPVEEWPNDSEGDPIDIEDPTAGPEAPNEEAVLSDDHPIIRCADKNLIPASIFRRRCQGHSNDLIARHLGQPTAVIAAALDTMRTHREVDAALFDRFIVPQSRSMIARAIGKTDQWVDEEWRRYYRAFLPNDKAYYIDSLVFHLNEETNDERKARLRQELQVNDGSYRAGLHAAKKALRDCLAKEALS